MQNIGDRLGVAERTSIYQWADDLTSPKRETASRR